jgi:Trk K+ transport system NAD-binding subunit
MATEKETGAGPARLPGEGPVLLCGLGRVGQAILRLLVRLGREVTVIATAELSEPLPTGDRVRVLVGNARDERLLEEAGLHRAAAVIVATDDDLANVAIALHARKAAPETPVVVRLFDEALAAHLKAAIGVRAAFSASALAAPAFVAAALGDRTVQAFEAGGEAWVVEERPSGAGDEQAVIARRDGGRIVDASGGPGGVGPGPGPDAGTVVVLARRQRAGPASRSRKGAAFLRGVGGAWADMPRGLRFAVFGMLTLVVTSIGLFRVVLHLPLVDAYYFVITTITTTGYGDISLQAAPAWVKVYGTLVMISGCALFAVLFSVITDVLLRTRLGDVMARGAAELRGHLVVAGMGNVGVRVLRELARHGEEMVVVQKDEDGQFGTEARGLAPVVVGDAGAAETLRRAGVSGAKTVLALTNDDLTNLSMALSSRGMNPDCRIVTRIFDRALAGKLSDSLGVDAVVSPADAAAPTFVASALDPDAVRGFVLGDRLVMVVHRKAGALAAGAGGAANERVLARRLPGDGAFRLAASGEDPERAETISVRWISLREEESA